MAADKIIVDIELKGLGAAEKGLADLTQAQIDQKEAIKETNKELKTYEKELKAIEKEQETLGELTNDGIKRQTELTDRLNKGKLALADQKDELSAVNAKRRAAAVEVKTYNKFLKAEIGSNTELRAQLKILTARYNGLSEEQRDNTAAGKALGKNILDITNKLKLNESAVGDNRRNVGNYGAAVGKVLGKLDVFGVNLGEVTSALYSGISAGKGAVKTTLAQAKALSTAGKAQKGMTASTITFSGAMKVLQAAIVSTGIGALVILLGTLVAAFASTQKGADAFTRAIEPIKFALDALFGVMQKVSGVLYDKIIKGFQDFQKLSLGDIFTKIGNAIKDNLLSRLEAFSLMGEAIVKILDGKMKEGFIDLGDAVVQAGTGIKDASGKIEDAGEAIGEVVEIMSDAAEEGKKYAEELISSEQAQVNFTASIYETTKAIEKQQEISANQSASLSDRLAAIDEEIRLQEKLTKQKQNEIQVEINLFVLKNKNKDKGRDYYKTLSEMQLKLTKLKDDEVKVVDKLKDSQEDLKNSSAAAARDRITALNQAIATEEQLLGLELQAEVKRLELNKASTELTAVELEAKTALYEKYYKDLKELREKNKEEEEETEPLFSELELEEKLAIVKQKAGEVGGAIQNLLGGISNTIMLNMQADINELDSQLQRGLVSQQEYEQKKEQIEKKANEKNKKVQITQAIIGGATAAVQALASTTIPFPFSLGAVAIIAAQTAAQVKAIQSQKFAEGGLIQGNSHAQGGVPFSVAGRGGFEAEGGEYIHKTKAVDHYGVPFMNALNNLQIPKMFAEGGYVTPSPIGSVGSQVSQSLSEQVTSLQSQKIEVINVEENFTQLQNKVNNVEQSRTY